MKRKVIIFITSIIVIFGLFLLAKSTKTYDINTNTLDKEIIKAHKWAYMNQITSKSNIDESHLDENITRVEMAKMISNFSKTILHHMPDTSKTCIFDDVDGIEPRLRLSIIQSCQFGLMGQNLTGFRPTENITRAEFSVILSRALFGEEYIGGEPYYDKSLNVLYKLGIIKDISNPQVEEKRGWVMVMLMRSAEIMVMDKKEVEDLIKRNQDVMPFILNNGNNIPVIGFSPQEQSSVEAEVSVYEAIKQGYRLIDTAKYYANEEGVGKGIKKAIKEGIIKREDIFISSKIIPSNYYNQQAAIEESLNILDLDYIDLMMIEGTGEKSEELYRALEEAIGEGKIRSIGLANYYRIEDFDRIVKNAEIMPSIIQNENNIYYQNMKLKEYVSKYGIIMEAANPFGKTGDIDQSLKNSIIQKLAEKERKQPSQIILRREIQDGYIPIVGGIEQKTIEEYFDIFDFRLDNQEIRLINMINTDKR